MPLQDAPRQGTSCFFMQLCRWTRPAEPVRFRLSLYSPLNFSLPNPARCGHKYRPGDTGTEFYLATRTVDNCHPIYFFIFYGMN